VAALEKALDRFGAPAIFNTDQGSQFTSAEWLNVLRWRQIDISMDGGLLVGQVFVERLWRSVKYGRSISTRTRGSPGFGPASRATSSSLINVARTAGSALESPTMVSLLHCLTC